MQKPKLIKRLQDDSTEMEEYQSTFSRVVKKVDNKNLSN